MIIAVMVKRPEKSRVKYFPSIFVKN